MASVLIIDDHQGTRDTYARILNLAGFETEAAASGEHGIEYARRRRYDVHLVDLRLPDMSGIDVVHRLKEIDVSGPIVIITAFPLLDSAFDAGVAGAAGYVVGPLFGEEVVDVVRQSLDGPFPVHHPTSPRPREPATLSDPRRTLDPRIRTIIQMIDEDLDRPSLVSDFAVRVNLSDSGLRHLFRASLGVGLTQFRTERRLQVAALSLTTTYEHIGCIARGVGLGNLPEFRRMFRARFEMSPSAYRALYWRGPRE
jgi:YesN/AraC family two-component response regulator